MYRGWTVNSINQVYKSCITSAKIGYFYGDPNLHGNNINQHHNTARHNISHLGSSESGVFIFCYI